MQLDQVLHDREPQAGAALGVLLRERALAERLQHLGDLFGRDAGPVVAHGEKLAAVLGRADAQRYAAALWA